MATLPSRCPGADGPDQKYCGDDEVGPQTSCVIKEGHDEHHGVIETGETERAAPEIDDVLRPLFGRWAVLAGAIANFGLGLSLPLATSTMFIEWQDTFKVSRAHTVAVHSTAIGVIFGAAIIPGYLMNRFGARFTVLLGCCLCSLGCFISTFATSIDYLIASVGILGGFGFCCVQLPSMPSVCQAFPKHGSIVVSCTFGSAILNMSMPFIFRSLINTFGWRGTFVIMSAFCMQTAVSGLIMTSHRKDLRQADPSLDEGAKQLESVIMTKDGNLEERNITEERITEKLCTPGKEMENCGDLNKTNSCTDHNLQYKNSNLNQINLPKKHNPLVFRTPNSKWNFLFDRMYLLIMFHIATCLAVQFSFAVIIMDFARTKGFSDDSTGTFFMLVVFFSSLIGRLVIGALNLLHFLHSMVLMGVFGAVSGIGMIMLGSATDYISIVVFFGFQGFGVGGVISIYPKCILDAHKVNLNNYPLALGLSCTWEGIFDFLVPILIGHAVDTRGSYTMILQALGSISMASSIALTGIQLYLGNLSCRRSQSDARNSHIQ